MIGRYILDEKGEPKECADLMEWARFMENMRNIVKQTRFRGVMVSTIFLGLDYSFVYSGRPHKPVLWETMVFGGKLNDWQRREASKEDALEAHAWAEMRARRRARPGRKTKPKPWDTRKRRQKLEKLSKTLTARGKPDGKQEI